MINLHHRPHLEKERPVHLRTKGGQGEPSVSQYLFFKNVFSDCIFVADVVTHWDAF